MTMWTRLEPHPRDGSMARGLQAQVRDPLWMLARQWQLGELAGQDAGSPVQAVLSVQSQPLTGYAPNADGTGLTGYDPAVALEPHIERVPVTLNVRGAAQLGRHAEAAIRAAVPPATATAVIAALRAAYPIAATVPPDAPEDTAGRAVRASVAGRVVDGVALAAAAAQVQAGQQPVPPLPPEAAEPGIPAVLAELAAYRASLYSEPAGDAAWRSRRLDYAATVTSASSQQSATLTAADFRGGELDWYAFSLNQAGQDPAANGAGGESPPPAPGPPGPAQLPGPAVETFSFLPAHVTFRGMPAPRWWEFEDAVTDFGALAPDLTDLATLLVMEFALVFGNDWFWVPVPTGAGTLSQVTTLVVSDTFGVRTVIEPAEQLPRPAGASTWSMFKISGPGGRSPFILMPPSCGAVLDGAPVEAVYFLRDDMAAMSWAVEHTLQGPLDAPVDALQLAFEFDAAIPQPPPDPPAPGGPDQAYVLEQIPPANWIPMVPVTAPSGARYFRRGILVRPGYGDVHAAARLLEPGHPLFVADESIPREGAEVTRYFRRARWTDGSTITWLAHRSRPGRGPGWSGLAFDRVQPLPPGPA
ncbi:MAG TPA: hypothetical protein VH637_14700 [Streptosporangiaceae bacterium]